METFVVDTNVLIRFLVGDVPAQKKQVIRWFQEATQGTTELCITSIVVAETTFVLESFYKLSREDISKTFIKMLSSPTLIVPDRDVLLDVWKDYIDGLHFVDSFLLSFVRTHHTQLLTFDKQMKKRFGAN